jgi:hypothetical protein
MLSLGVVGLQRRRFLNFDPHQNGHSICPLSKKHPNNREIDDADTINNCATGCVSVCGHTCNCAAII